MARFINITDFSDKELDVYARLKEPELLHYYEPQLGIFIAESPNVIERALNGGYEPISMLVETKELEKVEHLIDSVGDIPIFNASEDVLKNLTGYNLTRGALCAMRRKELQSVDKTIKDCRRIAILEDVVNTTNVGAIFRSAAALNIDAVLLTGGCADPLYKRAVRVSMGTVFQIPWTFIGKKPTDWHEWGIEKIKSLGFKTVAMALTDDSVGIDDELLKAEQKLAIILGTEGEGLQQTTIDSCDYTVKIPMSHNVDSLNVAAASAVAFWELTK